MLAPFMAQYCEITTNINTRIGRWRQNICEAKYGLKGFLIISWEPRSSMDQCRYYCCPPGCRADFQQEKVAAELSVGLEAEKSPNLMGKV
jgi:hypothetical protein